MRIKPSIATSVLSTILALSVTGISSTASAAVITQSDTFSTSLPISGNSTSMDELYQTPFSFAGFDSSLGTLSQIVIDVYTTQTFNVTIENPNSGTVNYLFTSDYGNVFGGFTNGSSVEGGNAYNVTQTGSLAPGASELITDGPQTDSESFTLTGADLLPFLDNPFSITVGIFQTTAFHLEELVTLANGLNFPFSGETRLQTDISIKYIYDDGTSEVPEPASLFLFSAGMLGLLSARRHKELTS